MLENNDTDQTIAKETVVHVKEEIDDKSQENSILQASPREDEQPVTTTSKYVVY